MMNTHADNTHADNAYARGDALTVPVVATRVGALLSSRVSTADSAREKINVRGCACTRVGVNQA